MKKILLIPTLLGVAVASGIVSARFLTAEAENPVKPETQSSLKHPGEPSAEGNWTSAETKASTHSTAKRSLAAAPTNFQPGSSQAKRLLNSRTNPTAPPSSNSTAVTSAGTGLGATSVPAGATTTLPAYSGASQALGAGSATGTSNGASSTSNGGGGAEQDAAPAPADAVSSGSGAEIVLNVPAGAVVPAAFVDKTPRTPQQQKALDEILTDFDTNVSTPQPGVSETENWNTARQIADQRYLTLFGYQAYNQYHLQAAKEALNEKKAVVSQPPTTP